MYVCLCVRREKLKSHQSIYQLNSNSPIHTHIEEGKKNILKFKFQLNSSGIPFTSKRNCEFEILPKIEFHRIIKKVYFAKSCYRQFIKKIIVDNAE